MTGTGSALLRPVARNMGVVPNRYADTLTTPEAAARVAGTGLARRGSPESTLGGDFVAAHGMVRRQGLLGTGLGPAMVRPDRHGLDEPRHLHRPRPGDGPRLLRLPRHRGRVFRSRRLPGIVGVVPAERVDRAEGGSDAARAAARPGHKAPWHRSDDDDGVLPALPCRPAGRDARPPDAGPGRPQPGDRA